MTELQYNMNICWFKKLIQNTNIQIPLYVMYPKSSFLNRIQLCSSNGLLDLSIPLIGGRKKRMPIGDLLIDATSNWHVQHWKTIQTCYKKSPFFEFYEQELKWMYENPPAKIWEWDAQLLKWLIEKFNLSIEITFLEHPDADGVITVKQQVVHQHPSQAIKEGDHLPGYFQVFSDKIPFQPNLSVLDLLFCEGPKNSLRYFQIINSMKLD